MVSNFASKIYNIGKGLKCSGIAINMGVISFNFGSGFAKANEFLPSTDANEEFSTWG